MKYSNSLDLDSHSETFFKFYNFKQTHDKQISDYLTYSSTVVPVCVFLLKMLHKFQIQ